MGGDGGLKTACVLVQNDPWADLNGVLSQLSAGLIDVIELLSEVWTRHHLLPLNEANFIPRHTTSNARLPRPCNRRIQSTVVREQRWNYSTVGVDC